MRSSYGSLPDWRKEEIEIREESNNRYPQVKIGWGWSKEDERIFTRYKLHCKYKDAIRDNENRILWKTRSIIREIHITSWTNFIKWIDNQYRCTLKELQSALVYAKLTNLGYYRAILRCIESGFYRGDGTNG